MEDLPLWELVGTGVDSTKKVAVRKSTKNGS